MDELQVRNLFIIMVHQSHMQCYTDCTAVRDIQYASKKKMTFQ